MTTARYIVGDVFEVMATMPDNSIDLVMTSPPFLALRSYLPEGHPDKHKEIGSEATPAEFLDTLLALTAEWGRLLAPHGSICVELGDTYAGSGGAGGDYLNAGLREGQPGFDGSSARNRAIDRAPEYGGAAGRHDFAKPGTRSRLSAGAGWPLDKSLCGIPTLYAWSLAYGRNLLTGQPSPAGRWRVRNLVAWVRPNPPVGALGDKFRPATSYLTIATRARDRYFDLDAVRTPTDRYDLGGLRKGTPHGTDERRTLNGEHSNMSGSNPAGAPPLDWWNHVDTLIDDEIHARAGKRDDYPRRTNGPKVDGRDGTPRFDDRPPPGAQSATGAHIRRRLEQAGYLGGPTDDVWDITPGGYPGAHYAVYPPELCVRPILAMTPQRVCTVCGEPSRRIVGEPTYVNDDGTKREQLSEEWRTGRVGLKGQYPPMSGHVTRTAPTVGWSDCGCNDRGGGEQETLTNRSGPSAMPAGITCDATSDSSPTSSRWRPGHVLDPFAGSGTTLAVATGHGRAATGIDLDPRNAALAQERCGMFLTIEETVAS